MKDSEVYYKIYKSKHLNNKLTVLCMQLFKESDYIEERFFKDKDGEILKFYDESEAINWLMENIKEEFIDPCYLKPLVFEITNDSDYYK